MWLVHSPCNCDSLLLPPGQLTSSSSNDRVKTSGKRLDEGIGVCAGRCLNYLFLQENEPLTALSTYAFHTPARGGCSAEERRTLLPHILAHAMPSPKTEKTSETPFSRSPGAEGHGHASTTAARPSVHRT